jgi:4-hydroxyacetophenone monooxygenase
VFGTNGSDVGSGVDETPPIDIQPLRAATLPFTESDEQIKTALEDVSVPALIAAIVQTTGDPTLLRGPIRPRRFVPNDFQGGLEDDESRELRSVAFDVLRDFRDVGCPPPPQLQRDTILETMSWLVCEDVPAEYVEMFLEEMDIDGTDPRQIRLPKSSEANLQSLPVLVIGAGASGLLAGIRLKQAGIPFVIVEKNPEAGGTWLENTYPGCRVDVGNHFYCYSFEPNDDFSEYYCRQPELLDYFRGAMHRWGVQDHVLWDTEVISSRWDPSESAWKTIIRGPDGHQTERISRILISAVGQLNTPFVPDLPGLDSFSGPVFHTANWDHSVDLRGKRVALIGAGASGFQVGPAIADDVEELVIFQRSAQWMSPNRRYRQPVGPGSKWAMRHIPGYQAWYRFMLLYQASDKALTVVKIDPSWSGMPLSANAVSEQRRQVMMDWIIEHVSDDEELLEKVTPDYPPMAKRQLQDDGSWLRCLTRSNVQLVRDPVTSIEPGAVRSGDDRYEVDVIVMATGFETDDMSSSVQIVGRQDRTLSEQWGKAPSAHLGIMVPGFPNFFIMYGPGTNLAHAGSIIFHSECQMQFIGVCLGQMMSSGSHSIEVRRHAHDTYVRRLQDELSSTVWAHPSVRHSWYKGPDGKVYVLSPWRLVDYWKMTKWPNFEDYFFA